MRTLAALALLALAACSNETDARRVLEVQGFTNIELHGWTRWGCHRDDATCDEFTARAPSGVVVRGVVGCTRWSTTCTVRLK